MRKPEKRWRKAVATGFLQAMTLIVLISAPVCRSQDVATACFPTNNNPASDGGGCIEFDMTTGTMPSMCGGVMAPNTSSTVYIRGSFPVGGGGGCPNVFLYAGEWTGLTLWNDSGPDPYVSLSNLQYVSPTLATFTLSVGGAPPGDHLQIQMYAHTGWIYFNDFMIWPPPTPSAPGPSQPNCPTISLAPVTPGSPATASTPAVPSTPISPNVWMAGVDNPIVIKGSGFTSQAVGDCIATLVTASLPGGPTGSETIPISNLKIVDDNTITAVVKPPAIGTAPQPAGQVRAARAIAAAVAPADSGSADSNTTETAYITLNGTPPQEGDNSASATAQIVSPKLSITQLQYTNSQDVWKDDPGTAPSAMSKTVWPPSSSSPSVSVFVSEDKIKATATFNISPTPPVAINGARIEGSVAGLGLLIGTVDIPAGKTSVKVNLTGDTAFPSSTTKRYSSLGVKWSFSVTGQPCSANPSQCSAAGATSSEVYVTYAAPSPFSETTMTMMPLTAVKLAIGDGGATSQTEVFNNTWQQFAGPANVKGWDGRSLYYYDEGMGFDLDSVDAYQLLVQVNNQGQQLTRESGQCGAWAHLLRDALAVNGIPSSFVTITPVPGTHGWMFINDWKFRGPPTYPNTAPWIYKFLLGSEAGGYLGMATDPPPGPMFGDLINQPGIAGQNDITPSEKAFNFHFIVRVDGIPGIGGPYFDPSYGATYTGDCDFETKAVAGYGEHITGEPANYLHVQKPFGGCSVTMRITN